MDAFYNLCNPAQIFASVATVFITFRVIFPKKDLPLSMLLKVFVLALLIIIGYTTIINYSCDSAENKIAWLLVTIPLIIMLIRLNNR
jgi:hypothetical protein